MEEDVTFTKYDINEMERAIDKMIDSFETIEYYASLINSSRYLSPEFLGDTSRLLNRGAGYEAAFSYDRGNVFDILEEMVNTTNNDE